MCKKDGVLATAMICIAFLDAVAISAGFNGVLFMTSVAAIFGIACLYVNPEEAGSYFKTILGLIGKMIPKVTVSNEE